MKDSSFLWYDKPASAWTQALPIGNGTLGGMIYGKVKEETVSLNHDELWTGHPKNTIRPGSLEAFQKARALALDGKLRESQDIIESDFMSTWSQAYLPLGDLVLTFDGSDRKSDYIRSLDLDTAIASVSYRASASCAASCLRRIPIRLSQSASSAKTASLMSRRASNASFITKSSRRAVCSS